MSCVDKLSSQFSLLHLRSAQETAPCRFTATLRRHLLANLQLKRYIYVRLFNAECRCSAWARFIFEAGWICQWVVTHSLKDFNFRDHLLTVFSNPHSFFYEPKLSDLNSALSAFSIAQPAYQAGPTGGARFKNANQIKHLRYFSDSKFESQRRDIVPPDCQSWL